MVFEEKTLNSELIYDGKIIKLRKDKVTVVNGESYREIIHHSGGSVIIPIDEDMNVIMINQFRKPVEMIMLEVPAGKIDPGEDPYDTAVRELKEETGITADEVKHLTDIYPSVGYSDEKLYIYMARGLHYGDTDFDENEAIDIIKMPLDKAVNMAVLGEISDAKTAIALLIVDKILR